MELTSDKQKEHKIEQRLYSSKNIVGLRHFLLGGQTGSENDVPTKYNKLVYDFDISDIYSQAKHFIGDSVILIYDVQKDVALKNNLTRHDNHVGYFFRKGILKDIQGAELLFDESKAVSLTALVDIVPLENIVMVPSSSSWAKFGFEFHHILDEKSSGYMKINSLDPITAYAVSGVGNVDSFFKNYYSLK